MKIIEDGSNRRIRCPICNCLFAMSRKDIQGRKTDTLVSIDCPSCGESLQISTVVNAKLDIYGHVS